MTNKKRAMTTFFKCKKGLSHEIFFNVFELVLAAVVIIALLFFINDVKNQTIFEKNYMARDLALLLNTFYAAPGQVTYDYNENLEDFSFDFSSNKVTVERKPDKESTNVFYPFAKNRNIAFNEKTLNYEKERVKIQFFKSAESINVDKPDSTIDTTTSSQSNKIDQSNKNE